jgi:hypothetical protein
VSHHLGSARLEDLATSWQSRASRGTSNLSRIVAASALVRHNVANCVGV